MFYTHPWTIVALRRENCTVPIGAQQRHWHMGDIHIDGGQSTVGDGAADGTSESKARVQSSTGGRVRRRHGSKLGLGGVDLAGASGSGGGSGGHGDGDGTDDRGVSGEAVVLVLLMGEFKAQKVLLEIEAALLGASFIPPTSPGQPTELGLSKPDSPAFPIGESRHSASGRARSTTPLIAQLDVMKALRPNS